MNKIYKVRLTLCVREGQRDTIKTLHVPSKNQLSDFLTNPLFPIGLRNYSKVENIHMHSVLKGHNKLIIVSSINRW